MQEITDSSLPGENELRQFLEEQQHLIIMLFIALTCISSLSVLFAKTAFPNGTESILVAFVLLFFAVGLYYLEKVNFLATAITAIVMSIGFICYLVFAKGNEAALLALAFPSGLAILLLGSQIGFWISVSLSLGLSIVAYLQQPFLNHYLLALSGIWVTHIFVRLALLPFHDSVQTAWAGYQESLQQLQEIRDNQMILQEAIKDREDLNEQLARVNHLAQNLRQIAEEERQTKVEFVANVSHELRTPLNMIIGFTEMIVDAPNTYGNRIPSSLLADLTTIHRNSQHLSNLVDDVLDLCQIEAQEMALSKEWVRPEEMVDIALETVRPLYQSRNLYLEAVIDEDIPPLFCDRTRIREVLINLLSNAGRFTEKGGVRVFLRKDKNKITFSVQDTGPGIPRENWKRLFEPFYQVDGSIRRKFGGSGLGLSISKRFVEMHDGRLWLESELGQGATFHFTLPVNVMLQDEGGAHRWLTPGWEFRERTDPRKVSLPTLKPRYILWDQDLYIEKQFCRLLEGIEIVRVENLGEVLSELLMKPAQALLVNQSECSDCLTIVDEMQALSYEIPIFSFSFENPNEVAHALGADGYILKPVLKNKLYIEIDRIAPEAKSILVVDDERDVQRLFHRMLSARKRGYQVLIAENGEQALEIMRSQQPDLVLLDLVMPVLGGREVLDQKTADKSLSAIKMIVTSAYELVDNQLNIELFQISKENGISIRQLITSIESLSRILAPIIWQVDEEDPVIATD